MMWKFLKQNVLFPNGLNWVQHWVSRIGLFSAAAANATFEIITAENLYALFTQSWSSDHLLQFSGLWTTNHLCLCSHWWVIRLSIGLGASRKGQIITGHKISDKGWKNTFYHLPATRRKYVVALSCFSCHLIVSLRFLICFWSKLNIFLSILPKRASASV